MTPSRSSTTIALFFLAFAHTSCSSLHRNPYEPLSAEKTATLKMVRLPFASGTRFTVHQGAFGNSSHNEPGNEYQWDMDVPVGTPVLAVEAGVVLDVWAPVGGHGCDPQYSNSAHNIKIRHKDGTVAQYVHIQTDLQPGRKVRQGEVIAHTALNGWICQPHLHFGIYRSGNTLYDSAHRETVPLRFVGVPDGLLRQGDTIKTP